MKVRIHNIVENTRVEGPGLRTAVWLQGCSIRCKGCMIPQTWDNDGGEEWELDSLIDRIISNKNIEGLTILGGEPFDQPEALHHLIKGIREKSDLSIMLFTGYTLDYLKENTVNLHEILSMLDIFIEGPYVESLTDFSRKWVGSSNQRIWFLSNNSNELGTAERKSESNEIEIRISKQGDIQINGMLPKEKLVELIESLRSED